MDKNYELEERVIERAMKPYPRITQIVPFSTPVVSFGNPNLARVVTIGINPSSLEFLTSGKKKAVLPKDKKRLVDLQRLDISAASSLNRDMAVQVINGCYDYFNEDSNPYMTWFKHLNESVNSYFDANYRDGTAAHLDLVQWATDPVWGGIKEKSIKEKLLQEDVEFLRYQVTAKKFDVIFLNGKQVFEQVTRHKIVKAFVNPPIQYRTKKGKLNSINFYHGESQNGTLVLGWSRTFPGHHISGDALPGVVAQLHEHFQKYSR